MKRLTFFLFNLFVAAGITSTAVFAQPANDNFANAETLSGLKFNITRTNVGATKEPGEANHANNAGGKSVWFKWVAPMSRSFVVSTARTPTNLDTLLAVYRLNNLGEPFLESSRDDLNGSDLRSLVRFEAQQGDTYYFAVDGKSLGNGVVVEGEFKLELFLSQHLQGGDWDYDGKSDAAIFRPSTGTWWIKQSSTGQQRAFQWGAAGDLPMAMTGSGTGVPSYAVYRPSNSTLYDHPAECCASSSIVQFGLTGDIPVASNFGGDQLTSLGVFRPSTGEWIGYTPMGGYYQFYAQFGAQGDIPVPGMYSGTDGYADFAVFRPSTGTWWVLSRPNNDPGTWTNYYAIQFGMQGDKPVQADYDGDGYVDIAVYRPSSGMWWILRSSDGQVNAYQWGIAEDVPSTGDYDADGKADIAVWRPSSGVWYILRSGDFSAEITQFGMNGDIPITANRAY